MGASTADAFTQKLVSGRVKIRTALGKSTQAKPLAAPNREAPAGQLSRLSQELQAEIAGLTSEQRAAEEAETSDYRKGLMARLTTLAAKSTK